MSISRPSRAGSAKDAGARLFLAAAPGVGADAPSSSGAVSPSPRAAAGSPVALACTAQVASAAVSSPVTITDGTVTLSLDHANRGDVELLADRVV